MAAHTPEAIRAQGRTIIKVGIFLFVMTAVTYGISFWEAESRALNMTIGLAIATVKALAVCLIFMHLKDERGIIYKFLLFAAVFFAVMMFLFVLGYQDVLKPMVEMFGN